MNKALLFSTLLFVIVFTSQAQKTFSEQSGDVLQFALPAVALGSAFVYPSDDQPTFQFLKSYALSLGTTYLLKYTIDEQRPNGGQYSFPSGHTASAFTGAAFLQMRYGWKIGLPAYLLAGYTGYTRVKADKHYWWDVLGGATIGIGSSLLFVKTYKKNGITWYIHKTGRYYLAGCRYVFD